MKIVSVSSTNKCPLSCSHCGPSSGPSETEMLELDHIKRAIVAFKDAGFDQINFTGGEPFLLGKKLVELLILTTSLNIRTRVTTGCYWSKYEDRSFKLVSELARAGLSDMYISISDFHLKFIDLGNVLNGARAARRNGIPVTIGLLKFKDAKLTARRILEYFNLHGEPIPFINDAPLIPFGRATLETSQADLQLQPLSSLVGPCPAILNHPMVHANGNISPCGSIFSKDCSPLTIGNIHDSPTVTIIEKMSKIPLYNLISTFGPMGMKLLVEKLSDLRFDSEYVNICHLCGDILHNERAVTILKEEKLLPV